MIRRIIWNKGDSPAVSGHMVIYVQGDGTLHIPTGFEASSATVAFSKQYVEYLQDQYGYGFKGEDPVFGPVFDYQYEVQNPTGIPFDWGYDPYLGYHYANDISAPEVYVLSMDTAGFTIEYRNIVEFLEISYYAQ